MHKNKSSLLASALSWGAILAHRAQGMVYFCTRPVTVGVKVLLLIENEETRHQEILLVRHTYGPGWHLPGGKVERGESVADAAVREVLEEVGVTLEILPQHLVGIYRNQIQFKHDHVVLFRVPLERPLPLAPRAWEIAEAQYFSVKNLPKETTPGTRRRIEEHLGTRSPDIWW